MFDRLATALLVVAIVIPAAARLQTSEPSGKPRVDSTSVTRRKVKAFDFDERPLGNFEQIPMYWTKLTGPGLPAYTRGAFDFEVGHLRPPSFRVDLNGGNVAYAYEKRDLSIEPQSDYLVVGYVKVSQLKYSRAFISVNFLDRFGDPISGSHRVSALAGGSDRDANEWQRLELVMPGKFPDATALRLVLWITQTHIWADPQNDALDPIVRQDIHGTAWFDDIVVYRLPRAGLKLSNPGGIVVPGRQERLIIQAYNFTLAALQAAVTVEDSSGKIVHRATRDIPDSIKAPIEVPLPQLSPGVYIAKLDLMSGNESLLQRTISFDVLAPLPHPGLTASEFGIDLGRWRGGDIAGISELLGGSGCGAIKIGVPAVGALTTEEKITYFEQISELLRRVEQQHNIQQTGVILTGSAAVDPHEGDSTRSLVASDLRWRKQLNPILAHFGGLFKAWQLGDEEIELRNGNRWTSAQVARARDQFRRFVTTPKLVVPSPPVVDYAAPGDVRMVRIPSAVPAAGIPTYVSFLAEPIDQPVWLGLEAQRNDMISTNDRITDLARRIALAAAFAPDRLYVDAPFELVTTGGELAWQPNEYYHVVRTMFHHLSGKHAVGVLAFDDDVAAIIFTAGDSGSVIMWTWREASDPVRVKYYLGRQPMRTDLWGNQRPVEVIDGLASITLSPEPIIVDNVNPALARLHASFRIDPTDLQIHTSGPRPTLQFGNYYDKPMTGTVTLSPPAGWNVEPLTFDFSLQPDETLSKEISFAIPARHLATVKTLGVHLEIRTPDSDELEFSVPLKLGLADITVSETIRLESGNLIVEQTLKNESDSAVSFSGFCQARGRPRVWRDFRRVVAGDTARQRYVFRDGDSLRGTQLHMGLREIRGTRTLDKLVEVK